MWSLTSSIHGPLSRSALYTSRGGGPVIAAQVRTEDPLPNAAAAAEYD